MILVVTAHRRSPLAPVGRIAVQLAWARPSPTMAWNTRSTRLDRWLSIPAEPSGWFPL